MISNKNSFIKNQLEKALEEEKQFQSMKTKGFGSSKEKGKD